MPLAVILMLAFMPLLALMAWSAWACAGLCEEWGVSWEAGSADPEPLSGWRRIIDPYVG
jgi:hypothetical protein